MKNSKTYLLSKIANHRQECHSLVELHAKHFDDIAEIMRRFAIESIIEVVKRINNGESVNVGGHILSVKRKTNK